MRNNKFETVLLDKSDKLVFCLHGFDPQEGCCQKEFTLKKSHP